MSKKSTRKSRSSAGQKTPRKSDQPLDRPFDPKILSEATRIVSRYRLTFEPDESVGYIGSSVEIPTVFAGGETIDECARSTIEALTGAVATMLELGERPPSPASSGKRESQINIRVTADERLRIEEAARIHGYRSVSDFLRAAALGKAG